MSSALQPALELLFLNDYASIAVVTAVVYDYILTFPSEIEYIWCKPWSLISTMFILIRYIGLCWIMISALICTSFIPGPVETCKHASLLAPTMSKQNVIKGRVLFLASFWAFVVFLSAADLVMILRVYAMFNRSRIIFYILLSLYVLQIITTVVFTAIFNNPHTYFSVWVVRVLDFSSCNASFTNVPSMHNMFILAPRFALGAVLIILVVFRTLRQSFEAYRVTKYWRTNQYMELLAKEGILYFLLNMLYQIACVINRGGTSPANTSLLLLNAFAYMFFYPLTPRFILNIRRLYARDLRGRCQEIDSGFGLSFESQPDAGQDLGTVSAMVFEDNDSAIRQSPAVNCDMDCSDAILFTVVLERKGQV